MSFKLRRGTDTERQAVVFAEGELVYTTDTKELYVGDGTTLGGIRITGAVAVSPIALTRNLDMNGFDIVGSGDIDISGQITANAFYGNGSGLTNLPALDVNNGATYQISIMGADSSIIVNSDTSELYGDLTGSVYDINNNIIVDNTLNEFYGKFVGDASELTNFPLGVGITEGSNYRINIVGDDSTVMVNSEIKKITATTGAFNNISINGNTLQFSAEDPLSTVSQELCISSNEDRSILKFRKTSSGTISNELLGTIFFEKDDANGQLITSFIIGADDAILLSTDTTGVFADLSFVAVKEGGLLGVGTPNPTQKLDVRGNGVFTGFVQFGSLTTTERNALTAANGMTIYNTTDNRFQGYQNGAWINLDDGTAA